ncbi:MAG TPA: hypothetical protein DCS28_00055 [Candidatus Moranbacteria bacterium]|nr:hypothetical protein [Candidatus Moranbacteria bacterium]HAT74427.1 hypothetical protein [Candidatus Moranbacteria bacterium]
MAGVEFFLSEIIIWAKLFYTSVTFSAIKLFLEIYVIMLIVNIILLLKQRGLGGDMRDTLLGMNIPPELVSKKGKLRAKWEKVQAKLKSNNESDYKVAIIEADNIIDDLIKRMKYAGENFGERLNNITPGQIENIEDLKKAHEIRNRIIHDESFILTKEEAEKTLGYFEEFLKFFMVWE